MKEEKLLRVCSGSGAIKSGLIVQALMFCCFLPEDVLSDRNDRHSPVGDTTSSPILLVAEPRAVGKRVTQRKPSDKATAVFTLQM